MGMETEYLFALCCSGDGVLLLLLLSAALFPEVHDRDRWMMKEVSNNWLFASISSELTVGFVHPNATYVHIFTVNTQ